MSDYTLYYFNARGRAESSRLALAAAGVSWEDRRVEMQDWPKCKEDMPFGRMPALDVKGKGKIAESSAIVRFIGREHGMMGKDSFEEAQIDMTMEAFYDLMSAAEKYFYEKGQDKQKEMVDKFNNETLPSTLEKIEKLSGSQCLVGSSLSVADIVFFSLREIGIQVNTDSYPKLKAVLENVARNPGVMEWIAKRPNTEH